MRKKSRLKIALKIEKGNHKSFMYPTIRKTQFFLNNKADKLLKNGYFITIRVSYGYGQNVFGQRVMFENSGTYNKVEDLKWAYQTFVKEYLKDYEST